MEGGRRFCFTDLAKIHLNLFTEFKKQQEMAKKVQENFVFDEIIVSILNNIRNSGLTYKHVASSQPSTSLIHSNQNVFGTKETDAPDGT